MITRKKEYEPVFPIKCKKHPRYQAKIKPRVQCEYCEEMFKHAHKEIRMDCPWYDHKTFKCRVDMKPCKPSLSCHKILDDKTMEHKPIPLLISL